MAHLGRWLVSAVLWTVSIALMFAQAMTGPPMLLATMSVLVAIVAACVTMWGVLIHERLRAQDLVALTIRAVVEEQGLARIGDD